MPFALLQVDPEPPSVEPFKRAVKALKRFTEADAVRLSQTAFGFLLKNLALPEAQALQAGFQTEGVPAEIVDMAQLPKLPEAKFVRRAEVQPQALLVYDPLNRSIPIEWNHIAILAAGEVGHFGVREERTQEWQTHFDPVHGIRTNWETQVRHQVQSNSKFLIDIVLTRGVMWFQIEAESFLFKYTFDRPELALDQKVGLLVRLISQHAPQAALNRGAASLRDGNLPATRYPSKAALADEVTWLLWKTTRG